MVVRLEYAGSLLRSSREYWSRWRSQTPWVVEKTDCVFPFHSIHVTWTAITLTGWLNLKWQVWADVSLHPCPTSGFWCMGSCWEAVGKKTKSEPIPKPKETLLSYKSEPSSPISLLPALTPLPPHVVSAQMDSSAYAWALWCCPCVKWLRWAGSMSVICTPSSVPSRVHASIQKCLWPTKSMLPRLESNK